MPYGNPLEERPAALPGLSPRLFVMKRERKVSASRLMGGCKSAGGGTVLLGKAGTAKIAAATAAIGAREPNISAPPDFYRIVIGRQIKARRIPLLSTENGD